MTERDREGLSLFLFTDTKDSYLAHFLSTSESENSAPPDRWPPSRSPTHPSRLKKGRFSAPEVPGPIPWPVLGPRGAGAAGRNDTADRSAAVVRRRRPPAKAKGPCTAGCAVDGAAYKGTQRHLGREVSHHID